MSELAFRSPGFPNLTTHLRVGTLKCPDCRLRMATYSCQQTLVHKCSRCHGLWFDEKKIAAFRNSLARFDFSSLEVFIEPPETGAYQISACPRCPQVLEESRYGYNTKVNVYRCRRCQGLWLPLRQMLHLMQSLQLSQAIAADVRGLLHEMGVAQRELRHYRSLSELSRWLCTPITAFDWLSWLSIYGKSS